MATCAVCISASASAARRLAVSFLLSFSPSGMRARIQHDGRGRHRAGKRTATHFVDTGNIAGAPRPGGFLVG